MASYDSTWRSGLRSATAERLNPFLTAVYGWMAAGLAITAVTAWFVAASPAIVGAIASNQIVFWGLLIAQLGLVYTLSARVDRLAASTAALLFILYSMTTGVTMAFVLLAFTGESVATTFLVTAGTFGALATYGTVTKRRLGGLGQFLFMGLIGIVIASIVGLFWQNSAFQFVLSCMGVILFSGLTVYDAQRLQNMAIEMPGDKAASYAIVGALALYLDFTNLFLFLLRFTGNRRE